MTYKQLIFGEKIHETETKHDEFKAVQYTNNLISVAREFYREYLNAFLNSDGGQLWFGIEDNGEVKGVFISAKQQNQIEFLSRQICSQFIPVAPSNCCQVRFIPVLTTQEQLQSTIPNEKYMQNYNLNPQQLTPIFNDNETTTYQFMTKDKQQLYRYVIVTQITKGTCSLYLNFQGQAWLRGDAGIHPLSIDFCKQRIMENYFKEYQFEERNRLLKTAAEKIIQFKCCYINFYGLPGVGKHYFVKCLVESLQMRCFYINKTYTQNENYGFKEQEGEILKMCKNERIIIIWDDYKYVEKFTKNEILKRMMRTYETFNKNMVLIAITRRNIFENVDPQNQSIFSFQLNQLNLYNCTALIKQHFPISYEKDTNQLDVSIKIARLCFQLGNSISTFVYNCAQFGWEIQQIYDELKKTKIQDRIKLLDRNLFDYLESSETVSTLDKQIVASFYLWDNFIWVQDDNLEKLSKKGLIMKQTEGYQQIQAVRKYCKGLVIQTQIQQQIEQVLSFYSNLVIETARLQTLQGFVQLFIDEQGPMIFVLLMLEEMIKSPSSQIALLAFQRGIQICDGMSSFDGMFDVELHYHYGKLFTSLKEIEPAMKQTVFSIASIDDWVNLWQRIM